MTVEIVKNTILVQLVVQCVDRCRVFLANLHRPL